MVAHGAMVALWLLFEADRFTTRSSSSVGAALPRLGVSRFEIDANRLLDLAQPQRQHRQRFAHGQGDRPDASEAFPKKKREKK